MSPLSWVRVALVLRQAGLPADDDAVQEAALRLRARGVPATRNGGKGNWKVQADHPETQAWWAAVTEQAEQAESAARYGY